MTVVCRQPSLGERKLKSVLADICDLQDNVYRCVDKTTCCKVELLHQIVDSLMMMMMLMLMKSNIEQCSQQQQQQQPCYVL